MKWRRLAVEEDAQVDGKEQEVVQNQDAGKPAEQMQAEQNERMRQNPANFMSRVMNPIVQSINDPAEKAFYDKNRNSFTQKPVINLMHLLDEAVNKNKKIDKGLKSIDIPPASQFKQPNPPAAPGQQAKPQQGTQMAPPQMQAKRPPVSAQKAPDPIEQKISAPGESLNLLGTDDVTITGDFEPVLNVKGLGPVNIPVTVTDVINKIKTILADQNALVKDPTLQEYHHAFQRITNVNIGNFGPGEAGHAESKSPHTININWEGMRQKMEEAVNAQLDNFAKQYGVPPQITADVVQRIKVKVAEIMWNEAAKTVAHESRHARDFQDLLRRMLLTGQGSLSEANESRAEAEEGLVGNTAPQISAFNLRRQRTAAVLPKVAAFGAPYPGENPSPTQVKRMGRHQILSWLQWHSPNAIFRDQDVVEELGRPATDDELRQIMLEQI